MSQKAVELTPDGHLKQPKRLDSLARSFLTRFQRFGELDDLDRAISTFKVVVQLTPRDHFNWSYYVNSLVDAILTRFERFGDLSELEQAILRSEDALALTTSDHPDKPRHLDKLSECLLTRFQRLGDLCDLELAILRSNEAIQLVPAGHPSKPVYLINHSSSLLARFERLGNLYDLEHAISESREAVALTPDGHPDRPSRLSSLVNSLLTRFGRFSDHVDLEGATARAGEALNLTPASHPYTPDRLDDLAKSLLTRFQNLGDLGDLQKAISRSPDAVEFTPDNHPEKPRHLRNLANSLLSRFQCLDDPTDLDLAISMFQYAVNLFPDDHSGRSTLLSELADASLICYRSSGCPATLNNALVYFSRAALVPTSPCAIRFRASLQWISCARSLHHDSLLGAYSAAIDLLPQLAWIGFPLRDRLGSLTQAADVAREAAAAALELGHPDTAVEWLEQGRAVVWGQLYQLRSPLDELHVIHPDLVHRFQELSSALEQASTANDQPFTTAQDEPNLHGSLEEQARRHRILAIERDKLLETIRSLPGFERFFLRKDISQLRASAHSGPVVILNAASQRCDALILIHDLEDVLHVPLPGISLARAKVFHDSMDELSGERHYRFDDGTYRAEAPVSGSNDGFALILSELWSTVVKPVLDGLAISTPGNLLRIFWCPTGPFSFLPIHAAGIYSSQYPELGSKLCDFAISSYVPTVSALALLLNVDDTVARDFRLFALRQPVSDGLPPLLGVPPELDSIRAAAESSPQQITLLESASGTVEEVLSLMKEADWTHFACHGLQDPSNPTDSGLCLANGSRLTLTDIIQLHRHRTPGGLAFLSACQTAQGDTGLAEEAVHMAAGMLFAGFGGVIGTMWAINDRIAPQVAKDVYESLFHNGSTPDYREAARALQDAVGRLREPGAPFVDWLPFIHIGV